MRRQLDITDELKNLQNAKILADSIVDAIPEPFVVQVEGFRVLRANRYFPARSRSNRGAKPQGILLYALGDGQWNISDLREIMDSGFRGQAIMAKSYDAVKMS